MDKHGHTSIDDFWDLASLVPSHKTKRQASGTFSPPVTPKTVSRDVDTGAAARPPEERRISGAPAHTDEVKEYRPRGNCLIESVRVSTRTEGYSFYGRFRRDAERYLAMEGKPCPFVKFFSYIPQYAQLSVAQLSYYLYWRSCVRRGEYPETEESYFYLYVYEIINLPDKIPPEEGARMLARVWGAYRAAFPRIDPYMAELLCDYCLIHALPCPQKEIRRFRAKILPHATLREFYLGELGEMTEEGIDSALAFFSDYRFRDSRYAQGENASLFEREIIAAVAPVLRSFLVDSKQLLSGATLTHRTREAFGNALCTQGVRASITLTYRAIADVSALRELLTNAVKYAENHLRMRLSVKSRLAVRALAPEYRRIIDAYFDAQEETKKSAQEGRGPSLSPADFVLDYTAAAAIEADSWKTTELLVAEGDADDVENIPPKTLKNAADCEKSQQYFAADDKSDINGTTTVLSEDARAYLSLLLRGDSVGAHRYAGERGRMEEELCEEINEISMQELGDISVEMTEDGYSVIPDYLDEVTKWTK